MNTNLTDKYIEAEEVLRYEEGENEAIPDDIVAFNEARSCAELFRMKNDSQLELSPSFQRDFLWSSLEQSKFIDSLIKQLPIPSLCIGLDYKKGTRIVIDGLQRISTIIAFLGDNTYKIAKTDEIDFRISGKTSSEIKRDNIDLYSRVQNISLPVTVIRYDDSKDSHRNYIFKIFHRLNSGGQRLTNQEIRNGIYQGKLNDLLKETSHSSDWKQIFKINTELKSRRYIDEEMVLRYLAFYNNINNYSGKLATFLNEYMYKNKNGSNIEDIDAILNLNKTLRLLSQTDLSKVKTGSKTIVESLLIGVAKNISVLNNTNIINKILNFSKLDVFQTSELTEGLSQKEKVKERINKSIENFSK
jgi:uncharacterized protein with ParB-like and HNH nuclease domain